jgi:hypothetical protein
MYGDTPFQGMSPWKTRRKNRSISKRDIPLAYEEYLLLEVCPLSFYCEDFYDRSLTPQSEAYQGF